MKFGVASAIVLAAMVSIGPAIAATATTSTTTKMAAPAMKSSSMAPAKTHYYIVQDASTKVCSIATKKPNGTSMTMVGKYWYSSKAKATAAMKKAAACKTA